MKSKVISMQMKEAIIRHRKKNPIRKKKDFRSQHFGTTRVDDGKILSLMKKKLWRHNKNTLENISSRCIILYVYNQETAL